MVTKQEIKNKIAELKNDERLYYPSANLFSNAPLALIQLDLGAKINSLEWVIGLPLSKFPLKTKC